MKRFWVVLAILLAILLLVLVYKLLHAWEFADQPVGETDPRNTSLAAHSEDERPMISYQGSWYALKPELETVLLMGLDKYEEDAGEGLGYRNSQQTDFMLLLVIDREAGNYSAIHLNRDTMAEIPEIGADGKSAGTVTGQLTLAHTYGSGGRDSSQNAVKAVSDFLYGTEIDHYVTFTMDAVPVLNDAVGGVEVTLLADFSDIDPRLREGEPVTLHGDEALLYVRSRGMLEDSTNLFRMERQRQYLNALYEALSLRSENDEGFLTGCLLQINDYFTSDCTINQLNELGLQMQSFAFLGIEDVPGTAIIGEKFMEYYVDEDALQELLVRTLYEPSER